MIHKQQSCTRTRSLCRVATCRNAVQIWLPQEADLAVTPYTEQQATVCGAIESQDDGVRQDTDLQMRCFRIVLLLK